MLWRAGALCRASALLVAMLWRDLHAKGARAASWSSTIGAESPELARQVFRRLVTAEGHPGLVRVLARDLGTDDRVLSQAQVHGQRAFDRQTAGACGDRPRVCRPAKGADGRGKWDEKAAASAPGPLSLSRQGEPPCRRSNVHLVDYGKRRREGVGTTRRWASDQTRL